MHVYGDTRSYTYTDGNRLSQVQPTPDVNELMTSHSDLQRLICMTSYGLSVTLIQMTRRKRTETVS